MLVGLVLSVLLHSTLAAGELVMELYSSEGGLVALGLGADSRAALEGRLSRFYDGETIFPAERGHELYRRQLEEYFDGRRRVFEIPLDLRGSSFQKAVWSAVAAIPFGRTASYGQIAQLIGRPGASRAVGAANGHNPIPIVIPCHRVIGADGSLTGYSSGLRVKRQLLLHEGLERLLPTPAVQMRLF